MTKNSINNLAINLKYYRYQSKLSQEKFAEAINTDYHYEYEMETAQRNPSLKMLDKLSENISDLLGYEVTSSELITYDEQRIIVSKRIDERK